MSLPAAAAEPTDASAGAPPAESNSSDYLKAIHAFRDVAAALSEPHELDDLLHLIARKICELSRASRCSVYLRDEETGLYRGQIGHADHDIDAQIKRLKAGVEADRFTREIVETKAPVWIRDTLSDPRPIRSTMRAWKIRSMIGVPMVQDGEVIGIVFLDREDLEGGFTEADLSIASAFADLAAVAISQTQLTSQLRESLATVARQNDILRRATALDERLTQLVLDGSNLHGMTQTVADLTGKPCALYDAGYERLAVACPSGDEHPTVPRLLEPRVRAEPSVGDALAGLDPHRGGVVGPLPGAGLPHRYLVVPVTLGEERWGTLVVMERTGRFGPLDVRTGRRAATMIALDLSAQRRVMAAEWNERASLLKELIEGVGDPAEAYKRAEFLGIDLDQPHVLCLVSAEGEPHQLDRRAVASAFDAVAPDRAVLVTSTADGVVVLLDAAGHAKQAAAIAAARSVVTRACARLEAGDPLAAISAISRGISDYARAFVQARQVQRCIRAFFAPGSMRVLTAEDLGAGRLLLMSADPAEADRFVDETLQELLDDGASADLLRTLMQFFDEQRSVRRVALKLDLHENTIRYRLARIEQLTGLPVRTDSDAQLSMQLALLILQMRGRLGALIGDGSEPAGPAPLADGRDGRPAL